MEHEAPGSPPRKMPYEAALMEVIKGLRDDPILLFGIGAGIVLVGVLAVTSSLPLVLVVAGVLVIVLLAGTHLRVQATREGIGIRSFWSSIKRNKFGAGRVKLLSFGSDIEGNEFGGGSKDRPERRED